ncbi:MAG: hypothetical protein RLZZ399_2237 [Verrucomicrobiota bacterium]|jgi:hypothetical protein
MQELGKWMTIAGVLIAALGGWLWKNGNFGMFGSLVSHLGRLPGDLSWQRDGVSVYLPITTCILLSLVITLLSWLLRR